MKKFVHSLIFGLTLILPFALANGAVNLVFSSPTASVASGGTFSVTLSLQVTAGEQVTGLDYYFQELSAAGFFIVSRDITTSPFSDSYFTNAQVASSGDAQLPAGADNALNPRNDYDLGAVTNPVGTTVSTGTTFVGTFVIGYSGAAAAGTQFTLSTASNTGTGWVGPGPTFPDNTFSNHASMLITIVPEPATWSLLGLGALGAFGLNLLRARARR